jgi:L-threonylcarbamoyladenylate synthase
LDSEGVDLILAAGVSEEGVGVAVMNRMKKAAGEKIINV